MHQTNVQPKSTIKHKILGETRQFLYFKIAYDSIDRFTVIRVLKDYRINKKIRNLINYTFNNTKSKIKTGLRKKDRLSPILFNSILEK